MSHDDATSAQPPKLGNPTHGRDLTVGSVPRLLVLFSLPMLAGSLIQTMYSLVNAFWVGKYLGKEALAAVSVSFPIFFVLIAIAAGITMAANILISQYAGAKEWDRVRQVVQTSTVLTVTGSLVLMLVGLLVTPAALRAMHTPEAVLPLAIPYMQLVMLTFPANFLLFLGSSTLRGVGDSTTPLYFQAIFLVVTAILDPMLMFGWLGFPELGLNGTAVATIITMGAAAVCIYIYLQRKGHVVAPNWRRLSINWPTAMTLAKVGMPSAIQQALVSFGMIFIVGFINHFGEDAAAAFGAAMRIDQFAFLPAMTISMAVSSLTGQNIGAQKYHRVRAIFGWGLLLSIGITAVISLVAVLCPHFLIGMFVNSARDPQVMAIGISYLRIVGAGYLLFAIMFVSNGVINGAGHTIFTTLVSLIAVWVVRVPLAALLAICPVRNGQLLVYAFHHTFTLPVPAWLTPHLSRVEGIWYAMVVGLGVAMLVSLAYYFSGRWKKAVVKHQAKEAEDALQTA